MDIKMKLDPAKLKAIADAIVMEARGVVVDARSAKGILGALAVAPKIVERVENVGADLKLLGSDKKEIAVQAVLALVPDRWVPDWVLAPFVAWAIERAVAALKERLGPK